MFFEIMEWRNGSRDAIKVQNEKEKMVIESYTPTPPLCRAAPVIEEMKMNHNHTFE